MRSSKKTQTRYLSFKKDTFSKAIDASAESLLCLADLSPNKFGEELYRLRKISGLRQVDVAHRTGLARGYLSELENSKRHPPPQTTIVRISAALGLSNIQLDGLRNLADAERCTMIGIPDELPAELACAFLQLAGIAYRLSPLQLNQITDMTKVIVEELNM